MNGPQPGQRFGRFELLRQLGQGGMGAVYRARDPELGREVAIKIVRPGRLSEAAQERLLREGQAVAALRHPNVIAIHSVGVEAGCPYLVCELIDGARELDAAFVGRSREERVELIRDAAAGLAAAHAAGLIHRDVKPANVVVDADDRVRVIDFGLVAGEGLTRMTGTGALVGTPTHMAPEQIHGSPATAASDVWALGVLLYQALTDALPFNGPTLVELSAEILTQDPTPPRALDPEVAPELEAVCLRALEKEPYDRYPDAAGFVAALDERLRPSPLLRVLPYAVGGLGLVALGGGLFVWWHGHQPVAPVASRASADAPLPSAPPVAPTPAVATATDPDLERGRAALERRDGEAAKAAFAAVLGRSPRSIDALLGIAKAEIHLKSLAAALTAVDRAISIAPDDVAARRLRADVRMMLRDPRGALKDLDRAIELEPKHARTYVSRAQILSVLAEDERALLDVETALELEPDLVVALWTRGQNFQLRGMHEQALRDFDRVLELDPDHEGARVRRARVYTDRKRLREARADLDHVLRKNPNNGAALITRTLVLTQLNEPRAALRDGDAAVRAAPRKGAAWAHRGHAKMLLKRYDEALLDYKQGLELDPKMAGAWAMVGNIRTLKRDLPGALEALTRSLKLNPNQGSLWFNRGRVHAMLRRYREAAQDFATAMSRLPPGSHTWNEAKRLRARALRAN